MAAAQRFGPSGRREEVDDLLLAPGAGPSRAPSAGRETHLRGETMGTLWSLTAILPDGLAVAEAERALLAAFQTVIDQMSQWEPQSLLSRFNTARPGERLRLPVEFAYVLDCSVEVARASGGAFDPTIGNASELWGFGASASPARMPGSQVAAQAVAWNWSDLVLDREQSELLQPGGLSLDFSGIAKGFAVDLGIHALDQLGIADALLEIGGEIRGFGYRPDGMPWWVDLEIPPGSRAATARVGLSGWAIATSGNYRRRRSAEGQSWSHSLDPASGQPVDNGILAVTVLHRKCMQADALATAILTLGMDRGILFADSHAIPARVVTPNETIASAEWRRWLD